MISPSNTASRRSQKSRLAVLAFDLALFRLNWNPRSSSNIQVSKDLRMTNTFRVRYGVDGDRGAGPCPLPIGRTGRRSHTSSSISLSEKTTPVFWGSSLSIATT
jgi:hypothetical protein